ncbi:conserved Plasmodium protein, unknown function [Plasmodium berghei]|uniref:Centrosomal protein of 70 kDa n=2 Tax=Plasmodium berghei TaxID=5821 RepID=A0A509AP41_PLABA|nr:conserved Plasmodium protein, unknown function [Plasmodium berghei ANKA]CXI88228.1 conserved Plasmodium protein, unknown function [Plasmodium berghei]SCL95915.1 conserved Plasmodium protein, unknown function [Plasmodium berghei]SCM16314.1 conserved Plasmodium protein, unknown function [Plasmodium berghei]SCM18110.1 conserved Plasmodium protein, unknown function [Plasmodium berghei]SCN27537.1 conserved Plasmodium protein, unknown function [Plasmodium berghei]|eukprot:XP_034423192.1 conserved Plasmodium protein, unknown function [Plasmodium berghei ANKA]
MSDDEFFQDKYSNSLQYIKCKTSTKIDDILKRRKDKKIKAEHGELKGSINGGSFVGIEKIKSEEKYNDQNKGIYKFNSNSTNKKSTIDSSYDNYLEDDYINEDKNLNSFNSLCINSKLDYSNILNRKSLEKKKFRNNNDDEDSDNSDEYDLYGFKNIRRYSKECSFNAHDKIKDNTEKKYSLDKYNTIDNIGQIAPINSISGDNILKRGIKTCTNISEYNSMNNKIEVNATSLENVNKYENDKYNNMEYKNDDYVKINTNDSEIHQRKEKNIYKSPSTDAILSRIKSDDNDNLCDNKDDIYANMTDLNKMYMQDGDMKKLYTQDGNINKTPTKTFSKSYFEYLKFETAGKMNISELETPLNLKDDKEDYSGNTPFIAYYLAGQTENKSLNGEEDNLENKISSFNKEIDKDYSKEKYYEPFNFDINSKEKSDEPEPEEVERIEIEENTFNIIKNNSFSKKRCHSFSNNNIIDINQMNTNDNKDELDIFRRVSVTSKKYNFIKTEEEYNDMLKERDFKLSINKIGSRKSTNNANGLDILEKVNTEKNINNNDVSFTDKIFSCNNFNIMNTDTFKDNLFKESKYSKLDHNEINFEKYKGDMLYYSINDKNGINENENNGLSKNITFFNTNEDNYDQIDRIDTIPLNKRLSMYGKSYDDIINERDINNNNNNNVYNNPNNLGSMKYIPNSSLMINQWEFKDGDINNIPINRSKSYANIIGRNPSADIYKNTNNINYNNKFMSINDFKSGYQIGDTEGENINFRNSSYESKIRNIEKYINDNKNNAIRKSNYTNKYMTTHDNNTFGGNMINKMSTNNFHTDNPNLLINNINNRNMGSSVKGDNTNKVENYEQNASERFFKQNDITNYSPGNGDENNSKVMNLMEKNNTFNKSIIVDNDSFIPLNKYIANRLSETADFGYKESPYMEESKSDEHNKNFGIHTLGNNDINNNNENNNEYNHDITKKYWVDVMKKSFDNIDVNEIKNKILNDYAKVNNNISENKSNMDIGKKNSFCKDPNEDTLAKYIHEQIKGSINEVIEKILSHKEINFEISGEKNNIIKKKTGHFNGSMLSTQVNNYLEIGDVKKEEGHYRNNSKINDNDNMNTSVSINNNNIDNVPLKYDFKNEGKNEEIEKKEIQTASNEGKMDDGKLETTEINNEMIILEEEDIEELYKLNKHLKMSNTQKIIEIKKDDCNKKKQIKWKDLLSNFINVIYYLINDNNKKTNKMNNLLSDINNISEFEKKIDNLNKENKKLKLEIVHKNDEIKKHNYKERINLNNKISDLSKKNINYEKEINIYKNKIATLNNKLINKDNEIDQLKKQYQIILDEIENCKKDAKDIIKQVLNKKHTNFIDKQCLDISKYYNIQMNGLKKEIKNLKDLIKNEAKEKILLNKKLNELIQSNKDIGSNADKNDFIETAIYEGDDHDNKYDKKKSSNDNMAKEHTKLSKIKKGEDKKKNEDKYKIMYFNLVEEMKEIKKNIEDQKITNMEQNQEIQSLKNQVNTSEKILDVYQNIFRENPNLDKKINGEKVSEKNHTDICNNSSINVSNFGNGDQLNNYDYNNSNNNDDINFIDNSNIPNEYSKQTIIQTNKYKQDIKLMSSIQRLGLSKENLEISKNGIENTCNKKDIGKKNDNSSIIVSAYNEYKNNKYPMEGNYSCHTNMYENPYLNSFVKMFIENTSHLGISLNNFKSFLDKPENAYSDKKCKNSFDESNKILYNNLMDYEKDELINMFVNICNDLKTDNIFIIVQFVKFLSFIVYEQLPLFTSFYCNVASVTSMDSTNPVISLASIISLNSLKFEECINVIKKWKDHYINANKYYQFRKNVLLIFQSELKDLRKNQVDFRCVDIIKNMYQRNMEISKFSNDPFEKAESIINKQSKEIISKIIKAYMNLYKIEKINQIIPHMNTMNSKIKTQSYFIKSISSCLNLNKSDSFQEIGNQIKELTTIRVINEKIKNRINMDQIDEYIAAYTIMGTLKKYLNITHTKDLLPSISKIIQKNKSTL